MWGPSYVCKQSAADLWAKVMAHAMHHDTWSATYKTNQRWDRIGLDWTGAQVNNVLTAHWVLTVFALVFLIVYYWLLQAGQSSHHLATHCRMRPSR